MGRYKNRKRPKFVPRRGPPNGFPAVGDNKFLGSKNADFHPQIESKERS